MSHDYNTTRDNKMITSNDLVRTLILRLLKLQQKVFLQKTSRTEVPVYGSQVKAILYLLGRLGYVKLSFLKNNGPTLASFSFIFGLFQQTVQFLLQIIVKKCPSSMQRWDSNSQPSSESPPLTTIPGHPPRQAIFH